MKLHLVVNGVAVGAYDVEPRVDLKSEVEKYYAPAKSITLIENGEIKNALKLDQSAEQQKLGEGAVLFVIQGV